MDGNVYWKTRAERIATLLADEIAELAAIAAPAPSVVAPPAEGPSIEEPAEEEPPRDPVPSTEGSRPEEAVAERPAEGWDPPAEKDETVQRDAEAVAQAMVRNMGYERSDAREMVAKGLEKLRGIGRPPTADEILNTALTGRLVLFGSPNNSARADFRRNSNGEGSLNFETSKKEGEEKREEKEGGPAEGNLAS